VGGCVGGWVGVCVREWVGGWVSILLVSVWRRAGGWLGAVE
jgi:hypothetical protein